MYTNLLLFLVAIFLFSADTVPDEPLLPGWQGAMLFVALLFVFQKFARKKYSHPEASLSTGYFRIEKQLSVMALGVYAIILYLCDVKYYFSFLSFGNTMPALVNVAGIMLFLFILAIIWRAGRKNYGLIFGREHSDRTFVVTNIKANLPIVLPWIVLSFLYDIVGLLPFPGVQKVLGSEWGDLFFFGIFFIFVLLFFPPLVRRLWGCKKLQEGELKSRLDTFCAAHNFSADYYLWPLFEGRMLTAGVMGIVPGLRYILLTPALIETMSEAELEAVMAHEIGHVKRYHLLLYVLLVGGFSLLASMLAEPSIYFFLSLSVVNKLVLFSGIPVEDLLVVVSGALLLLFMLVYFRFVFGYFIRNFERQADLFSMVAIGESRPLVSAFEKIALLSGNIRDKHNWHHFGIGERIDCLERAGKNPVLVGRHDKKVRYSLLGYVGIVLLTATLVHQIPTERLMQRYQENFAEPLLLQKAKQEPERALWQRLIGDLMLHRNMEHKALAAYEKAYSLEPVNPEIMNNYSWLLLTSKSLELRDPSKALTLARAAVTLQPKGYILDTLATAYWANGLVEEAVRVEKQAILADVTQKHFFQSRIAQFTHQTYEESVRQQETKENKAQNNTF